MPVPSTAFTLNGGCGCKAIRYTLNIPEESSRYIFLSAEKSEGQGDVKYPLMLVCHCNHCRSATGMLAFPCTMCPAEYGTFDLLQRSDGGEIRQGNRIELAGMDVIKPTDKTKGTYLQHYQSPIKEAVTRSFCGRCGTPIAYVYHPPPPGWKTSLDMPIGTFDREDIERISIDRHVWWDYGIDWVQKLMTEGDGSKAGGKPYLPRHSTIDFTVFAD